MTEHHTIHCPNTIDGWKKEIAKAWNIIKLDEKQMKSVAADDKSMGPALAFIVLAGLAGALGSYVFPQEISGVVYRPNMSMVIGTTLGSFIGALIGMSVISLIAQYVFKGKAKITEFIRAAGYAALIGVAAIVPVLSIAAGLWSLVVIFMLIKNVHKLDIGAAIGTLVLTIVLWLIVVSAFMFLFFGTASSYMMY